MKSYDSHNNNSNHWNVLCACCNTVLSLHGRPSSFFVSQLSHFLWKFPCTECYACYVWDEQREALLLPPCRVFFFCGMYQTTLEDSGNGLQSEVLEGGQDQGKDFRLHQSDWSSSKSVRGFASAHVCYFDGTVLIICIHRMGLDDNVTQQTKERAHTPNGFVSYGCVASCRALVVMIPRAHS